MAVCVQGGCQLAVRGGSTLAQVSNPAALTYADG